MFAILIGTRPEAIKLKPIISELKKRELSFKVIYSGQQASLERSFFTELDIPVHESLLMREFFDSVPKEFARQIDQLAQMFEKLSFEGLFVQGDTTTALAGAYVASMLNIPIYHVEAGLRTHDPHSPFPEELNRRVISVLANRHFAPKLLQSDNLLSEGIPANAISVVGNTIVDSLVTSLPKALGELSKERQNIDYIFVSCHRRELTSDQRTALAETILELSTRLPKLEIHFTLHANPMFSNAFEDLSAKSNNIFLYRGLSYSDTLVKILGAKLVITDSGGLQEECATLGIPLLVYRSKTERPECIRTRKSWLFAPRDEPFVEELITILIECEKRLNTPNIIDVVGDGQSARRILDVILGTK